jgi:hypothetical protein
MTIDGYILRRRLQFQAISNHLPVRNAMPRGSKGEGRDKIVDTRMIVLFV